MKLGQLLKVAGTFDRAARALVLIGEYRIESDKGWTWVRVRIEGRRTDSTWNGITWDVRDRDSGKLLAEGFQPGWTEALDSVARYIEREGESWI